MIALIPLPDQWVKNESIRAKFCCCLTIYTFVVFVALPWVLILTIFRRAFESLRIWTRKDLLDLRRKKSKCYILYVKMPCLQSDNWLPVRDKICYVTEINNSHVLVDSCKIQNRAKHFKHVTLTYIGTFHFKLIW